MEEDNNDVCDMILRACSALALASLASTANTLGM